MFHFYEISVYSASEHKKIGELFIVQIYTGYFFKPLTYATNACVSSLRITKKSRFLEMEIGFFNK